jgi:hypothetical protein
VQGRVNSTDVSQEHISSVFRVRAMLAAHALYWFLTRVTLRALKMEAICSSTGLHGIIQKASHCCENLRIPVG